MQFIGFKKKSTDLKLMVIGPSDINKIFLSTNLPKNRYNSILHSLAKYFSKICSELYIIPDNGVFLDFAVIFKKYNKNVFAYLPKKEELKYDVLMTNVIKHKLTPIFTNNTWLYLNNVPIRNVDIVLCLGYSTGVLIEIGNIKIARVWYKKNIKLLVDLRFVSKKLPKELLLDLPIIYLNSISDTKKMLI